MANTQPTVDTPDGQIGVVSAQFLMGSFPGTTTTATLGVPPNTETVVLQFGAASAGFCPSVIGVQSGTSYSGTPAGVELAHGLAVAWFFDVSPSIDSQITITFSVQPAIPWTVYSDSGVHVVADPNLAAVIATTGGNAPVFGVLGGGSYGTAFQAFTVGQMGNQYVTAVAPGVNSPDHPVVEMQWASEGNAASGVLVIAAPGAGNRIRVFSASAVAATSTGFAILTPNGTSSYFLVAPTSGLAMTYGPTGIIMPANTGVELVTTTGVASCSVVYTVETI